MRNMHRKYNYCAKCYSVKLTDKNWLILRQIQELSLIELELFCLITSRVDGIRRKSSKTSGTLVFRYLSLYLLYLSINLSIYLSIFTFIYLYVQSSICLYVSNISIYELMTAAMSI